MSNLGENSAGTSQYSGLQVIYDNVTKNIRHLFSTQLFLSSVNSMIIDSWKLYSLRIWVIILQQNLSSLLHNIRKLCRCFFNIDHIYIFRSVIKISVLSNACSYLPYSRKDKINMSTLCVLCSFLCSWQKKLVY